MATKQRRGIQSVEVGSKLLEALALGMTPMSLGDIAKDAGMTAGKAHPYMVSFTNVGFVAQDGVSGKYELGSMALQLGLAKLATSFSGLLSLVLQEHLTILGIAKSLDNFENVPSKSLESLVSTAI